MKLRVTIEPRFCGPVSVGTVGLIMLLKNRCGFGLAESKSYVDRAVFGGESVEIPLPSTVDGETLASDIRAMQSPVVFNVCLIESNQ